MAPLVNKLMYSGHHNIPERNLRHPLVYWMAAAVGDDNGAARNKTRIRKYSHLHTSILGDVHIDDGSSAVDQFRSIVSDQHIRVMDLFWEFDRDKDGKVGEPALAP